MTQSQEITRPYVSAMLKVFVEDFRAVLGRDMPPPVHERLETAVRHMSIKGLRKLSRLFAADLAFPSEEDCLTFVTASALMGALRSTEPGLFTEFHAAIRAVRPDTSTYAVAATFAERFADVDAGPQKHPHAQDVPKRPDKAASLRTRAQALDCLSDVEALLAEGRTKDAERLVKEWDQAWQEERERVKLTERGNAVGCRHRPGESLEAFRARVREAERRRKEKEEEIARRLAERQMEEEERRRRQAELDRLAKRWEAAPEGRRPERAALDRLRTLAETVKTREFKKACYAFEQAF